MSDRGSYRAIPRALLDGKDFQTLSPIARAVFVALKVGFGPAGIEVHYPEALLWQLSHQTGWTPDECAAALVELEDAESRWIQREGNVVWIVGQLRYEPSMSSTNPKHRKAISTHIKGLPRIAIVRAFVTLYRDWFDDPDSLSKGYPEATEAPKTIQRQKPKTEVVAGATPSKLRAVRPSGPAAPPPPPAAISESWVTRLVAIWEREVGRVAHGRLGADLKATIERHDEETVTRAMRRYITAKKEAGQTCGFAFFVGEVEVWIQRGSTRYEVIDGEMNDALERATRPARVG